jgi:predicted nucleotidyltransferase
VVKKLHWHTQIPPPILCDFLCTKQDLVAVIIPTKKTKGVIMTFLPFVRHYSGQRDIQGKKIQNLEIM